MAVASSRIVLEFGENNPGQTVINWEEYSFDSDFLIPCDAFQMTIGDKSVTSEMRKFMQGGQKIKLFVELLDTDGNTIRKNPVFTGYLDKAIEQTNSRGGTFFTLHGRNILGPLCDSGIDPWSNKYKFTEGQTLGDVMGAVFNSYGIHDFFTTDIYRREITTGIDKSKAKLTKQTIQVAGTVTNILSDKPTEIPPHTETITQWIDPTNRFDLAEKSIKKLQPRHDQTVMQFVEEHLARFSQHCWAMPDGSGVIIGQPDYTQEPLFNLINTIDGKNNNVLNARIQLDFAAQPSMIIAKGFSGGGDFQNTRIKVAKINEFIGYPNLTVNGSFQPYNSILEVIQRFKGLNFLTPIEPIIQNYSQYFTPPDVPKVIYWEDEKSRTIHQLESAVMRKMSEYQRHAFKLHYTVQDHHQNKTVWTHNTVVNVNDQILGIINQPFWVASVSMKKSRTRGTTTDLTLIPLYTLVFGPP